MNKENIRQHCLANRQSLSKEQRNTYSKAILHTLLQHIDAQYSDSIDILCYRSLNSEVSTLEIFKQSNRHHYYAPCTQKNGDMHWLSTTPNSHWKISHFNIQEPATGELWQATRRPAILICPVVCFDQQGNRIGMGKGCFDRWLETYRQEFDIIIGLAFACQQCPAIPCESHDIPLDAIITEKGWIPCPNT